MNNSNVQNHPNYFKLYLLGRGILPASLHTYISHEFEDKKLGNPPEPQTVVNWVEAKGEWKLTPSRWQAIADAVNLTIDDLKVLFSGRIHCATYSQQEITRIMERRKSISDPSFNLRYLIKAAGITQVQFAEMLGVGGNTVRRWCAGRSKPSLEPDQYDIALELLRCTPKEFRIAVENACPVKVSPVKKKKLEKFAA